MRCASSRFQPAPRRPIEWIRAQSQSSALFEQRRSCRDVMQLLSQALGLDEMDYRFFENLAREEIIVPGITSRANTASRTIGVA